MSSKPLSTRSRRSSDNEASERSPLLPQRVSSTDSPPPAGFPERALRWPSTVALLILCGSIVALLSIVFFAPTAAEQYTQQATVLDISSLSIHSFTEKGLKVKARGTVNVDASRVKNAGVRLLGRIGARIVGKVYVQPFEMRARLPDYQNALLGIADMPAIIIDIRNGHSTVLDLVCKTEPGSLDAIRLLANDFVSGNLHRVKVLGEIDIRIKTGLITLGPQRIAQEFIFKDIPGLPKYKIDHFNVEETHIDNKSVVVANVTVVVQNPYPVGFEAPPLGFVAYLPGCEAGSLLQLAAARSSTISIKPNRNINIDISATIQALSTNLTTICSDSQLSPLDVFLGNYLHGGDSTVYVSGDGANPFNKSPQWLVEFLHSVNLPVPLPGRNFDNVIRSFGLSHVNFKMPGGSGDPDDIFPQLSATVEIMIALPEDMNMPINIVRLKATSKISYQGKEFGMLDVKDWIPARSKRILKENLLRVEGDLKDAPINITDYDVFQRVARKIFSGGGKGMVLGIDGNADADIVIGLGQFAIQKIPAHGNITLDGLFPDFRSMPLPKVGDVVVESSTEQSINIRVGISVKNPTPWEVIFPYSNVRVSHDGTFLGNGTVKNLHLKKGVNNFTVLVAWDPHGTSGKEGEKVGSEVMGEYISGYNTTLSLSTHEKSFPTMPSLGRLMSDILLTLPMPPLIRHGENLDSDLGSIESSTVST